MTESNPLQRTGAWLQQRAGCLTASSAAAVLERSKRDGKPLKAYYDLKEQLIAERATGQCIGIGTTAAMQWGIDHEADARAAYEAQRCEVVDLVGFVPHPSIKWLGASPDGLVGDEGLVEIKCPNTVTHLKRIATGVVPDEYKPQMLVQLLCTGRKWVDFVDFDPRLQGPYERHQLFVVRYEPTAEELEDAKQKCVAFLNEVEEKMQDMLRTLNA